ncbi:10 kDa heat shock protein, mitochondrial [Cyclospora cayetanensis]|uniref:10 kDa heat shock protein, mitochondrial n=2 Tax=Cyclospora cayetanensis TaxID=88456 RepID=A0A6P5WG21_9EIME|nr:10 kDa heat shock protein, mitochondrial [Cyclospora cayetanensis]OEH79637.1 putative chaperonin CPN10, mitochondrial [Cyclospora cayetanensis]
MYRESVAYVLLHVCVVAWFQSGLASRIMPLFGRCVVEKLQPATLSKGGIYIPSSATQQSGCQMAKVVAVSPPKQSGNNSVCEDWAKLQVGQTVMVPEFGGMKIQMEDEEVFVFRGEDILAIVKDQ